MARILVIDDQPAVRATITLGLRLKGFDVVEAESAAAALNEFGASKFDLAIVDIFLQGTNGADLIRILRQRAPSLPIVAISGVTALDFLSAVPDLSNVVCLQKPFRPIELFKAIQSLLGPLGLLTDGAPNIAAAPNFEPHFRQRNLP
jgi:DNA-binding response OmpR family regulator